MAGVPNLRGMTVTQAQQALQGSGYSISNISAGGYNVSPSQVGGQSIVSYTTYPDGTVRLGLNSVPGINSSSVGNNSLASGGTSSNGSDTGSSSGSGTSGTGTGVAGTGTAVTAPSPAGSPAGGTTNQIPGWAVGTGYDTSAASAGSANGTVTPAGGVQQYQQTQGQAMSMLSTFFGTGAGYAPQYLPSYGAGATQPQAQQVTSGSASGLPAAKSAQGMQAASGSVT